MDRKKLYRILSVACVAGYLWLFLSLFFEKVHGIHVCLFKHIAHIPCPSCGSTRAIMSILEGHWIEALYWNPLGFVIAVLMLVLPLWLIYDWFGKKVTLLIYYQKVEIFLRQRLIAIPLIVLVVTNWIWNISKGL